MKSQKSGHVKQYLVLAHYDGDHQVVDDLISARLGKGPARFVVLVPATPPHGRSLTWTEEQAHELAERRLQAAVDQLSGLGADVTGEIGAESIPEAIGDTLRSNKFDEVILATPRMSLAERFLGALGSNLTQVANVPVTQVTVPRARAL